MDDFFTIWVLPTIGGLVLYAIMDFAVTQPGRDMQKKFAKLEPLSGKTYAQIKKKCGAPASISTTTDADGETVQIVQWMKAGFHIVLLFDMNDVCLGVSSITA